MRCRPPTRTGSAPRAPRRPPGTTPSAPPGTSGPPPSPGPAAPRRLPRWGHRCGAGQGRQFHRGWNHQRHSFLSGVSPFFPSAGSGGLCRGRRQRSRRPRLLPGQLALCPPELGRRHGLGLGAVAGAGEEEKWMVGPPWTHAPPPCTEQLGCCPVVPPSQESKEATGQTWDDAKRQAYQQWKSSSGAAQQVRARGDSHGAGPAACRHCMCPLHVPAVSQSWGIGATNKHVCRLVVRTPP